MPNDPNAHTYTLDAIEQLLHVASLEIERCRLAQGDKAAAHAKSAAWRIADAGLMLRGMLEREEIDGVGITSPTGRMALLPAPVALAELVS